MLLSTEVSKGGSLDVFGFNRKLVELLIDMYSVNRRLVAVSSPVKLLHKGHVVVASPVCNRKLPEGAESSAAADRDVTPLSTLDLFRWPDRVLSALLDTDVVGARLVKNLACNIISVSDYSGMGCHEVGLWCHAPSEHQEPTPKHLPKLAWNVIHQCSSNLAECVSSLYDAGVQKPLLVDGKMEYDDLVAGKKSDAVSKAVEAVKLTFTQPSGRVEQKDCCLPSCDEPLCSKKSKYCMQHKRIVDAMRNQADGRNELEEYQKLVAVPENLEAEILRQLAANPNLGITRGARFKLPISFTTLAQVKQAESSMQDTEKVWAVKVEPPSGPDNCPLMSCSEIKKLDRIEYIKYRERKRGVKEEVAQREWDALRARDDIRRDYLGEVAAEPLRLYIRGSSDVVAARGVSGHDTHSEKHARMMTEDFASKQASNRNPQLTSQWGNSGLVITTGHSAGPLLDRYNSEGEAIVGTDSIMHPGHMEVCKTFHYCTRLRDIKEVRQTSRSVRNLDQQKIDLAVHSLTTEHATYSGSFFKPLDGAAFGSRDSAMFSAPSSIETTSPPKPKGGQGSGDCASESEKKKRFDISAERVWVHSTMAKDMAKGFETLRESLIAAVKVLVDKRRQPSDDLFAQQLDNRVRVCRLLLMEDPNACPIPPEHAFTELTAVLHDLEFTFVSDPTRLLTQQGSDKALGSILACKCEEELKEQHAHLKACRQQLTEMAKSMRRSSQDLQKSYDSRDKAVQRAKEKEEADLKRQGEKESIAARDMIQKASTENAEASAQAARVKAREPLLFAEKLPGKPPEIYQTDHDYVAVMLQ
eukprot:5210690-Amphidinium_carterae.1